MKRKSRILLFILELFLILLCIWKFLIPLPEPIHYKYTDLISESALPLENFLDMGGGYYIDNSMNYQDQPISIPPISLSKGSYTVSVTYKTDAEGQTISFSSDNLSNINILHRSRQGLEPSLTHMEFPLSLSSSVNNFSVNFYYNGNSYLLIQSLDITPNRNNAFFFLYGTIIFLLFAEILYYVWKKNLFFSLTVSQKNCYFLLLCAILFSSLPLFQSYLFEGHDLMFHLGRIEGIKEGLIHGHFPVKILSPVLNNKGYPTPIFYGDTLLYFPALLRILGCSVQTSYKIYVFFINCLTGILGYFCFKKIFKNNYASLLSSVIYLLSPYRLTCIYVRAAVGEYTAMTFLPLILVGFYLIFTEDPNNKAYKKLWLLPAIGLSGILQSHILTCEVTALFLLFIFIILWKKLLCPSRLLVLVKTGCATILLNLWFLVPFLDYIGSGVSVTNLTSYNGLQWKGAFLSQLLSPFTLGMGYISEIPNRAGQPNELSYAIGLTFLLVIIIFVLYYINLKEKNFLHKLGCFCFCLSILALWMSSQWFPYDALGNLCNFTRLLVRNLQFPCRLGIMSGLFLTTTAGCLFLLLLKSGYAKKFFVLLGLSSLCVSGLFFRDLITENHTKDIRYKSQLDFTEVGTADYLPNNLSKEGVLSQTAPYGNFITINEWTQENTTISVKCVNDSETSADLSVPLVYYEGYVATLSDNPVAQNAFPDANGMTTVTLPPNFSGTVVFSFQEPWYWRSAEVISLAFLFLLIGYNIISIKKNKSNIL